MTTRKIWKCLNCTLISYSFATTCPGCGKIATLKSDVVEIIQRKMRCPKCSSKNYDSEKRRCPDCKIIISS